MMLEAVESRFAAIQAPHALEWLTDNGSVYTAHETRAFATALNLVPCFTPIQSPESNGISESFVKTFKRDYVRVNPLPDAITALRQIAGWFLDYNENHPHSGLKMRSPREFMYSHASPIVRSVPPSFVGSGEVSFPERYSGRNMAINSKRRRRRLLARGAVIRRA